MKHTIPRSHPDFSPDDFPALNDFFSAYLHEDFADEYGSVGEAAKAFLEVANPEEVKRLRAEWKNLRQSLDHRPIEEVQAAVRRLGAAWQPNSASDLGKLDVALA